MLDRIAASTRIFEAWRDEPWVNDGAAVRVSLVAFGNDPTYNARDCFETFPFPHANEAARAAIAAAYGWTDYTPDMPDAEILRRLLALNLARHAAEGG